MPSGPRWPARWRADPPPGRPPCPSGRLPTGRTVLTSAGALPTPRLSSSALMGTGASGLSLPGARRRLAHGHRALRRRCLRVTSGRRARRRRHGLGSSPMPRSRPALVALRAVVDRGGGWLPAGSLSGWGAAGGGAPWRWVVARRVVVRAGVWWPGGRLSTVAVGGCPSGSCAPWWPSGTGTGSTGARRVPRWPRRALRRHATSPVTRCGASRPIEARLGDSSRHRPSTCGPSCTSAVAARRDPPGGWSGEPAAAHRAPSMTPASARPGSGRRLGQVGDQTDQVGHVVEDDGAGADEPLGRREPAGEAERAHPRGAGRGDA